MQTKHSGVARPAPGSAKGREGSLFVREPLLLLALLLGVFYLGRPLLIPLALALTFTFLFAPLVGRLERLRVGRTPAVLLVLAAATALLGGIVWLVGGQLLTVVNDLPSHAPNIRAKLARTHVPSDSALGQAVVSIEGLSKELSSDPDQQDAQQRALTTTATARARSAARKAAATADKSEPTPVVVVQAPASELAYLRQLLRPVVGPLGTAGMVLIFATYMLIKRDNLRNRLLLLAGIGRIHLVSHALDDAGERISRYLIANVAVNAGFGVVFAAGLYAIGIPYPALWGTLLGLLRTVPYVGPLAGGGLPVLFALIYFPTWWQAGCTLLMIGLLEILVSNFLEPWLYGAHTGISELALLAMAVVWTLLWGWPGLALSTPLTVCLIVVGRTMPQMSFLHVLLGDDAELTPEASFYERMLAMDLPEARTLAERFLQQGNGGRGAGARGGRDVRAAGTTRRTPLDLYETVLLPALALAENDRHRGLLEEPQASFLMQSIAELVAELTTYAGPGGGRELGELGEALGRRPDEALDTGGTSVGLRRSRCPVVCVPVSDHADEIAATMLAQVLETSGHKTLLLPPAALTPELLLRFAREPGTVILLSAVPPFAFTGARALYARLRAELPANPLVIGLWRSPLDPEQLRRRFGMQGDADRVVVNLRAALLSVEAEAEPVSLTDIFARKAPPPPLAHAR